MKYVRCLSFLWFSPLMCKTLRWGLCILNLLSYPFRLTQNTPGMANGDRMHYSIWAVSAFSIGLILMLKSIYSLDNVILKQKELLTSQNLIPSFL